MCLHILCNFRRNKFGNCQINERVIVNGNEASSWGYDYHNIVQKQEMWTSAYSNRSKFFLTILRYDKWLLSSVLSVVLVCWLWSPVVSYIHFFGRGWYKKISRPRFSPNRFISSLFLEKASCERFSLSLFLSIFFMLQKNSSG